MMTINSSIQITTIDLLRHGACENGESFRGTIDVALSDKGWQQMTEKMQSLHASEEHSDYQQVISSPMVRCLRFAERFSTSHTLPLSINECFREMSFGEWEGQSIQHIRDTQPDAISAWADDPVKSPPPGGEPADILTARVAQGLEALVEQYAGEHLLLVSHGGVMRALLSFCLSMPIRELNRFHIPYACLSRIQVVTDRGQHYYRLLNHNLYDLS